MEQIASRSNPIERKRSWGKIVIASLAGGTLAVIAAPSITAVLAGWGIWGFVASTTATGILGSVTSKVAANTIDADLVILTVHQYPAQRFYRLTVTTHIGTVLESVFHCLRTHKSLTLTNRVYFELDDTFEFRGVEARQNRKMFFEFSYEVIPKLGSSRRPLGESIPPPALATYDEGAVRGVMVGGGKGLLDGTGRAVLEGCLFGVAGGALGSTVPKLVKPWVVPIVRGEVDILVGISSFTGAAGPAKDLLMGGSSWDRATLFLEFSTELQSQVNRVLRCATDNEIGIDLKMAVGIAESINGRFPEMGAMGSERHDMVWFTEAKV
ncbi:hypothetical protein BJX99DRAFT_261636 [Aspergillus californicus]